MGVFLDENDILYVVPDKHPYEGHQKFFMDRFLPVGVWNDPDKRPNKKTGCKFLDKISDLILHFVIKQVLLYEKKSGNKVRFDLFKVGQKIGQLFMIRQTAAPDGFIELHTVNDGSNKHIKPQCIQYFCNTFLSWNELDQTKGKWSAGNAMHALVFCHFTLAFTARNSLLKLHYPQFSWIDNLYKEEASHWFSQKVNPHYLRNRSRSEAENKHTVFIVFV